MTVANDVRIKILNQINFGAFIKKIKIDTKEIKKNQKKFWEITEIILKGFEEMMRQFQEF